MRLMSVSEYKLGVRVKVSVRVMSVGVMRVRVIGVRVGVGVIRMRVGVMRVGERVMRMRVMRLGVSDEGESVGSDEGERE